jgi:poly(A) polymerase
MVVIAGHDVELVTARVESYAEDSRKPDEVLPGTIAQDARRRDFTINTLLENLHTGETLDPTGCGLDDIRKGIIRTPTEPERTFIDDPLRMLRAIRFAARLGFAIDPATWDAMRKSARRLSIISRERIRDEFNKVMLTPRAAEGLELLRESGLLAEFIPELLEMVGVTQNEFHALKAVESVQPDAPLVVRLAVLFHDIGKPRTRSVAEGGHVHFYRHEDVGAEMARDIMTRLKYSNDEINTVALLVAEHMRIGEYKPAWTDAAVRRLIRDLGRHLDSLFAIHRADVSALAPGYREMTRAAGLRARIAEIESQQDILSLSSPLDGNDIMKLLGLSPGPEVKAAKDFLTRAVVDGSLGPDDRAGAEALLRRNFGENNNS